MTIDKKELELDVEFAEDPSNQFALENTNEAVSRMSAILTVNALNPGVRFARILKDLIVEKIDPEFEFVPSITVSPANPEFVTQPEEAK